MFTSNAATGNTKLPPMNGHRPSRKPRLIVLIRHGESESNRDKSINQYTPNHMIPLTTTGWAQARATGAQLLKILNVDDESIVERLVEKYHVSGGTLPIQGYARLNHTKDTNVVFYTSPYKRTRQTLKGILDVFDEYNALNSGVKLPHSQCYEPEVPRQAGVWGVAHPKECRRERHYIEYRVKDDPRIREQDFGNFQETHSMKELMQKRSTYGHFFFRFKEGESAADVYDRVASFQETLYRHFDKQERKPRDVVVLVTHGIYSRVFLMKWFRWTYEEFESFSNIPNGSMVVMELDETIDRYVLRTILPKWI